MSNILNKNYLYQKAQLTCQKWLPDELIDMDIDSLSPEEWDKQCQLFDKVVQERIKNCKPRNETDVAMDVLCEFAEANSVEDVSFWVAYLKWLDSNNLL